MYEAHFKRYTNSELHGPDGQESRWFRAVKGLIRHLTRISKGICRVPSLILSLDEMLRQFKGQSAQTERMQRKPDKEGYKLHALCDKKTAFVYEFFPSGRLEKTEVKEQV